MIITLLYVHNVPAQGLTTIVCTGSALPRSRATQCLGVYPGNPLSRGPPSWGLVEWLTSPRKSRLETRRTVPRDPILDSCANHHHT
jgi:hypothetical protein